MKLFSLGQLAIQAETVLEIFLKGSFNVLIVRLFFLVTYQFRLTAEEIACYLFLSYNHCKSAAAVG